MVVLAASLLAAGALLGAAPPQRALVAGPAFAGSRVVWGEQDERVATLRAWPDTAPLWQSSSSWFTGPLVGSHRLVSFARSYDGCSGQPGVVCPVETQALAGPPHGSLHALGPAERCTAGAAGRRIAASGALVAFLALGCDSSADTVTVYDGTRIVGRRSGAACCDVSLAGSLVAWRDGGGIDVLDLRAHRLLYRAGAPPGEAIAAFELQADGKLALVLGPAPDGRYAVAWRARAPQTLHRMPFAVIMPPASPAVRLAGDRLVAIRPGPGRRSDLVVAGLDGRPQVLARFASPVEQVGAFDADAGRVTWASRRITSSRVECPPPGQGRPCGLLRSGVLTIWLSNLRGAPRSLARWAFVDAP